jgi:ferredoxin
VTESPRLYILFRTAVRGILPVIHLRFGVCAMAGWCGACHVTVDLGAPWALEALRIDGSTSEERSYMIFYMQSRLHERVRIDLASYNALRLFNLV